MGFPVQSGLWAVHERSFRLTLPGEDLGTHEIEWQEQAAMHLRLLRRTLGRYRALYALPDLPSDQRASRLADMLGDVENGQCWSFEPRHLKRLAAAADSPEPVWRETVQDTLREFRRDMGNIVGQWRRENRNREHRNHLGKTVWALDYLNNTRRFLMSWSLLGQSSGDIRRLDRDRRGIFAANLLDHIDGIKQDRLKTGADLIIQAARGQLRDDAGRWGQRYQPCQVVLFEDLSRYRMRTDRPRRENSLLMKWAHRSLPQEVEMQGQLYGIHVCDTAADFSSRYHAATMTPGIRAHAITKRDLQDQFFLEILARENPGLDTHTLYEGQLVPLGGGEWFLAPLKSGLVRIHADINAAQNLQRRFWTRHGDAFRLPCARITLDGEERWVPRRLGKRLLGALGGHGILVPTGHDSGSCRWEPVKPARWRKLSGTTGTPLEEEQDQELAEIEGLAEEALEQSGEVVVFFRDPSGNVLPRDLWYPSATFWSIVKARTAGALKDAIASRSMTA